MKKMKEEKRVKDLVLNLPSRMLKKLDENKFSLLNDKSYYYDENTYIPLIQEFEEQEKAKLNHTMFMNSNNLNTNIQNISKNAQNTDNAGQVDQPMSNNNTNNPIVDLSSSSNNHKNHIPLSERPEIIKEEEMSNLNQLDLQKNVSQPMNNQAIVGAEDATSKKFLTMTSLTS